MITHFLETMRERCMKEMIKQENDKFLEAIGAQSKETEKPKEDDKEVNEKDLHRLADDGGPHHD